MLTPAEFDNLSFGAKVNIVYTLGKDVARMKSQNDTLSLHVLYNYFVETYHDPVHEEIIEIRRLSEKHHHIELYADHVNIDDLSEYMGV